MERIRRPRLDTRTSGEGSSCPIVFGDAIFVTAWSGEGDSILRHLIRVDLATGEKVWEKTVPVDHTEDPAKGYITEHGYASNTPVTDGEAVYCYFGKAGVYAFDLDGKQLWKAGTGSLSSPRHGDPLPARFSTRTLSLFRLVKSRMPLSR